MGVAATKLHPIYDVAHRVPLLKVLDITTVCNTLHFVNFKFSIRMVPWELKPFTSKTSVESRGLRSIQLAAAQLSPPGPPLLLAWL